MLNWPNRLSILRILLLPVFVGLMLNAEELSGLRYVALGVFALMALCDVLDGYLARRLGQRSRLGSILDPLADKTVLVTSIILLTYPRWPGHETVYCIPKWVTVVILSKDVLVMLGVAVQHLAAGRIDMVRPTLTGKVVTALAFILVLVVLMAPDAARLPHAERPVYWFVMGLAWTTAALSGIACLDYVRLGSKRLAAHGTEDSG